MDDAGNALASSVVRTMRERGWAARLVPAERRFDLWSELEQRLARGELDATFFEERFRPFRRAMASAPRWARSILLVAIPDVASRIRFSWGGNEIDVTVPPTYLRWKDRAIDRIATALDAALEGTDYRLEGAAVPKKLLATRTGLAKYGRNNLTYADGMGSYYRLVSLYTSLPCREGPWHEPKLLPSCHGCGACLHSCPTGAITADRFLLYAERCLAYWNEKPGGIAFPEWIERGAHDQLVGCMRCQIVCPENAGRLVIEESGPAFSDVETEALLRGTPADELSRETVDKLERHGLLGYLEVIPRNLAALLDRPRVEAD